MAHGFGGFGGCGCGCASRRQVLTMIGGVATLAGALTSPATAAAASPAMVDVHHHVVPPFWFDEVKDHIAAQGGGRIVPNWYGWSPEKALAKMDQTGVATAMLSVSSPGVWFGDAKAAASLSRRCNEYMAELVVKYPGRFGMFAAIPLPDRDTALAELDYAYDHLNADGVGLLTSYGDKWIGDPAFAAVLDGFNRRKAVVYVHPASPLCCTSLMPYVPPFLTEFIQDTNRAVLSLMYSGSLARLTDTRFIFSHAGGGIPVLAGRIRELAPSVPALQAKTPHGVDYELRKLYYEVANSANRSAVAALTNEVPTSQILFGSDFPLVPLEVTAEGLPHVGLSRIDLKRVQNQNARRLFPRLLKAKA